MEGNNEQYWRWENNDSEEPHSIENEMTDKTFTVTSFSPIKRICTAVTPKIRIIKESVLKLQPIRAKIAIKPFNISNPIRYTYAKHQSLRKIIKNFILTHTKNAMLPYNSWELLYNHYYQLTTAKLLQSLPSHLRII